MSRTIIGKRIMDPDPEFVSLVDKGASRRVFRVLKRDASPRKKTLLERIGILTRMAEAIPEETVQKSDAVSPDDVLSLVFDKEHFSLDQARAWAKKHELSGGLIDETDTTYRLRQVQKYEGRVGTVSLMDGVSAVVRKASFRDFVSPPDLYDGHVHKVSIDVEDGSGFTDSVPDGFGKEHSHEVSGGMIAVHDTGDSVSAHPGELVELTPLGAGSPTQVGNADMSNAAVVGTPTSPADQQFAAKMMSAGPGTAMGVAPVGKEVRVGSQRMGGASYRGQSGASVPAGDGGAKLAKAGDGSFSGDAGGKIPDGDSGVPLAAMSASGDSGSRVPMAGETSTSANADGTPPPTTEKPGLPTSTATSQFSAKMAHLEGATLLDALAVMRGACAGVFQMEDAVQKSEALRAELAAFGGWMSQASQTLLGGDAQEVDSMKMEELVQKFDELASGFTSRFDALDGRLASLETTQKAQAEQLARKSDEEDVEDDEDEGGEGMPEKLAQKGDRGLTQKLDTVIEMLQDQDGRLSDLERVRASKRALPETPTIEGQHRGRKALFDNLFTR